MFNIAHIYTLCAQFYDECMAAHGNAEEVFAHSFLRRSPIYWPKSRIFAVISLCVWSSLSADWASTGYDCQSCWSTERGEIDFSLSSFASESLVSRVRFGCPVPCQLALSPNKLKLNLVLTYGTQSPIPAFRYGF